MVKPKIIIFWPELFEKILKFLPNSQIGRLRRPLLANLCFPDFSIERTDKRKDFNIERTDKRTDFSIERTDKRMRDKQTDKVAPL